jgi:hypothetical protein
MDESDFLQVASAGNVACRRDTGWPVLVSHSHNTGEANCSEYSTHDSLRDHCLLCLSLLPRCLTSPCWTAMVCRSRDRLVLIERGRRLYTTQWTVSLLAT